MLTEEREEYILNELRMSRTVKLHQLMQKLDVSESTIRRDLSQLEERGLLTRIHGGAKLNYHIDKEPTFDEKNTINNSAKLSIGQKASQMVNKGDVIYIDAGTTTAKIIPYLENKPSTVVTNGLLQAYELSQNGYQTILLGGKIKNTTQSIVGISAQTQLSQYVFDKAFIGINGIHSDFGLTTADEEEAAIKSLVINRAGRTYIMTDSSKFNKVSFCKVCNLDEVTIITNKLEEYVSDDLIESTTILEVK